MKKIVLMLVCISVMLSTAGTAYAMEWEPRPNCQGTLGCINGEPGSIISSYDKDRDELTYYCDDNRPHTLIGWEFPTLEEGYDYEVVCRSETSVTIKKLNYTDGIPYVNALVEYADVRPVSETAAQAESEPSSIQMKSTQPQSSAAKEETAQATAEREKEETTFEVKSHYEKACKSTIIISITVAAVISTVALIIAKNKK